MIALRLVFIISAVFCPVLGATEPLIGSLLRSNQPLYANYELCMQLLQDHDELKNTFKNHIVNKRSGYGNLLSRIKNEPGLPEASRAVLVSFVQEVSVERWSTLRKLVCGGSVAALFAIAALYWHYRYKKELEPGRMISSRANVLPPLRALTVEQVVREAGKEGAEPGSALVPLRTVSLEQVVGDTDIQKKELEQRTSLPSNALAPLRIVSLDAKFKKDLHDYISLSPFDRQRTDKGKQLLVAILSQARVDVGRSLKLITDYAYADFDLNPQKVVNRINYENLYKYIAKELSPDQEIAVFPFNRGQSVGKSAREEGVEESKGDN